MSKVSNIRKLIQNIPPTRTLTKVKEILMEILNLSSGGGTGIIYVDITSFDNNEEWKKELAEKNEFLGGETIVGTYTEYTDALTIGYSCQRAYRVLITHDRNEQGDVEKTIHYLLISDLCT